jgi:bifunctional N-acetylglucosamine-1-phosphate-uridyltransferase/glucosamine-1-phosphate-acetyltransferase GlmU-like protein
MEKLDLTKTIQKANNIIASCTTCVHVKNAANYLENFKQQTNNEEYYTKLVEKLNIKRQELGCDFRY